MENNLRKGQAIYRKRGPVFGWILRVWEAVAAFDAPRRWLVAGRLDPATRNRAPHPANLPAGPGPRASAAPPVPPPATPPHSSA